MPSLSPASPAPSASPASSWYAHELYVNFAEPLSPANRSWVARVTGDLGANLDSGTPGTPVRIIDRQDTPTSVGDVSTGCAIMILFLTPEFRPGHAGWAELEAFHRAIAQGQRTADQLVVCELQRYPDSLRGALPWVKDAASPAVTSLPLFSTLTQVAFTAEDKVQENCWRLRSDIASRLAALRENHSAAVAALTPPKHTGLPNQAYLMEYSKGDFWSKTRTDLMERINLVIYPQVLGAGPESPTSRRERRDARRRLLESCQALLLLRGAHDDDLIELSAAAIADLKSVGEGVRPICIDWVGAPPPAWPPYFRPDTVDASRSWITQVESLLSAGDPRP